MTRHRKIDPARYEQLKRYFARLGVGLNEGGADFSLGASPGVVLSWRDLSLLVEAVIYNTGGRKPDVPWDVGLPRARELMKDRQTYPTLIAALRAVDSELSLVFNSGQQRSALDKALYAWHKRACAAEQRARQTGLRGLS